MAEASSAPVQVQTDNEAAPPASEVKEILAPTSPEAEIDPVIVTAEKDADDDNKAPPAKQVEEVAAPAAYGHHDGDILSVQSGASKSRSVARMSRRITVTAASAPFDRSYHASRFRFYSPPKQRQRWGDTQILPRTNWGDLFFDLFYVAAAYNVSNILVEDPSREGLLYFLGTFLPVMQIWYLKMYYDGRFVTGDDLFHRVFEIAGLVALASAVVHIRPENILSKASDNAAMFAFCLSLTAAQFIILFRFAELYRWGVGEGSITKELGVKEGVLFSVTFFFCLAASIVAGIEYYGEDGSEDDDDKHRMLAEATETPAPSDYGYNTSTAEDYPYEADPYPYVETTNVPIWLCLMSFVVYWVITTVRILFFLPNDGSHKKFIVPVNIDFVIHRSGEWTMLMLGESILSLLIIDVPEEDTSYFATFYCSLMTVILLQYLHFRSQPHYADDHALRRDKNAGIFWTLMQFVYSASLIALGGAFTIFVLDFSHDDDDEDESRRLMLEERFLAGGGVSKYAQDDLRQMAAHVFSAALTLVFFSLDFMSVLHVGKQHSRERCYCSVTKKKNYKGYFLLIIRGGFICFVATLSQWVTDPEALAEIGLVSVAFQICMRVLGAIIFPSQVHAVTTDDHGHKVEEDSEENKWPNTTHAEAEHHVEPEPLFET